jgi:hypothetical protein
MTHRGSRPSAKVDKNLRTNQTRLDTTSYMLIEVQQSDSVIGDARLNDTFSQSSINPVTNFLGKLLGWEVILKRCMRATSNPGRSARPAIPC